jgi:hypothetical protein
LNNEPTVCSQCGGPLIETNYYGERLVGCVECNLWRKNGEEHLKSLTEEDLQAIESLSNARHKAEDTSPQESNEPKKKPQARSCRGF